MLAGYAAPEAGRRPTGTTQHPNESVRREEAEVAREYVPFPDRGYAHGVTFDGHLVWFARNDEVVAFDPESEKVVRRLAVPSADAGTAFDGEHLYQLAKGEILVLDPSDGRVLRRFPAPADGLASGMTGLTGASSSGSSASRASTRSTRRPARC